MVSGMFWVFSICSSLSSHIFIYRYFTTMGNRNTFKEPYPHYFNSKGMAQHLKGAPLWCGGQGGRVVWIEEA
jgi:hypothetical protein